jgi:predicted RNase H-like HicB family nuclease
MPKIRPVKKFKGEIYPAAEGPDLPGVTQGKTLDEAAANIREAINLHLEGESLPDFDILSGYPIPLHTELDKGRLKVIHQLSLRYIPAEKLRLYFYTI